MDPRSITEDFAVSPQITPAEVAELRRAGYGAIICNRPDGEDQGQPDFDEIAAAAREAGIEARWIPIASGVVTAEAAKDFRDALDTMPGPVLAYCRSGTRCAMLWSLAQIGRMEPDRIREAASRAGYDVSGLLRQAGTGSGGTA